MPAFPTTGAHPLTGVAKLPNVSVAHPGEIWTDRIASEPIVPGEAVMPTTVGGKLAVRIAETADLGSPQLALAMRTVDVPDRASDSQYTTSLGPNEIKNLEIAEGDYVMCAYSGVYHLTLVRPRAWVAGELVTWNPTGARPTGKSGTGSWDVTTDPAVAVFEVQEFRPYSANGQEGLLTVRSLRGQF